MKSGLRSQDVWEIGDKMEVLDRGKETTWGFSFFEGWEIKGSRNWDATVSYCVVHGCNNLYLKYSLPFVNKIIKTEVF